MTSQLKGWMTPRYVAHSYVLPHEVVRESLELEAADLSGLIAGGVIAVGLGLWLRVIQRRDGRVGRQGSGHQ